MGCGLDLPTQLRGRPNTLLCGTTAVSGAAVRSGCLLRVRRSANQNSAVQGWSAAGVFSRLLLQGFIIASAIFPPPLSLGAALDPGRYFHRDSRDALSGERGWAGVLAGCAMILALGRAALRGHVALLGSPAGLADGGGWVVRILRHWCRRASRVIGFLGPGGARRSADPAATAADQVADHFRPTLAGC